VYLAAFYVRDEETSLPVGYPLLLTFDQESPLCSDVFDIVRQALEPVIATPMNISFRIVRISDVTVLVNEQVPYQGSINDTAFLIMLSGAQVNFDQLAALTVSNREIALDDTTPQHNFRVDLKECINLFSSEEQLSKRDQWFCPDCKADKQAFKKFDLFFLPEILVIHFKRFQYGALSRGKLETPVDYPFELDLSEWVRSTEHKRTGFFGFFVLLLFCCCFFFFLLFLWCLFKRNLTICYRKPLLCLRPLRGFSSPRKRNGKWTLYCIRL
jgi:hypothetical protein